MNKYRVDEICKLYFVDGLVHRVAGLLYTVGDVKIVDGAVNGIAKLIGKTSDRGRRVQSGYVQQYAFTMDLGLRCWRGCTIY